MMKYELLNIDNPYLSAIDFGILSLVELDIFTSLKCLIGNSENIVYFKLEFCRLRQAKISSSKSIKESSQLDFWNKHHLEKLKY